jgi:EAL domain-containing protein (putative c-di-GMP-specific phosphodiesterase class I)
MSGRDALLDPAMPASLGGDALTLHYQPVADRGGVIVGMEALMRWHHHDRGPVSPEAFIPIFERSGLIVPVSRWALGLACRDGASWQRPLQIAVNLSAMQFGHDDLPALVETVLDQSGLAPERLELEVTEAALVSGGDGVARTMRRLRNAGVAIVLADFGTGRSGPAYLKDYPFSGVKIARGLTTQFEQSASARSIIHMVIELAHSLGLHVAADDVETPEQLGFLVTEGCDRVQGFLIGRPGPINLHAALTGAVDDGRMPLSQDPRAASSQAA